MGLKESTTESNKTTHKLRHDILPNDKQQDEIEH